MIKYRIPTRQLWINEVEQLITVATPYSGHGVGLNNPAEIPTHNIGPLPLGVWGIGEWFDHPHLGKMVAALTPIDVPNLYGRSGFFIHGDNSLHNHSASNGCLVLDHNVRKAVKDSVATRLTVIV